MERSRLVCAVRRCLLLCALALSGAMVTGCDAQKAPARSLELTECRLPKVALAAQCGRLEVPENRSAPGGRKIGIAVAILPANTLNPAPDPFVILAGGPGQAATYLGPFAEQFVNLRRKRDIVLIDQRGTGRSSPLECAAFKPVDSPEAALELDPVPRATRCARELAQQGVDASQYTTPAWIADIEAVRAALGYDKLNLWGGSYGTRAALEYLRAHPEHVRTVVLDGVAPPSMRINLDVWITRDAAIGALFDACAASSACNAAQGSLASLLDRIAENLGPYGRDVTFADPRTGAPRTAHLTLDHVVGALQPLVYVPEYASLVPAALGLAKDGDFSALYAAAVSLTSGVSEQLNSALYYSVTCSEDAPRVTAAERESRLGPLRARELASRGLDACEAWPHDAAVRLSQEPVRSDVPVLILSGGLDPVTPPANGAEVAKTLPNSRHIVAKGYGHNVSPHVCTPRLIAAFVDEAGFSSLPADCVALLENSTRPPLWSNRLGPQP